MNTRPGVFVRRFHCSQLPTPDTAAFPPNQLKSLSSTTKTTAQHPLQSLISSPTHPASLCAQRLQLRPRLLGHSVCRPASADTFVLLGE